MKRLLDKQGVFRLFSSAVIDQAVLSAANFAVGLLLIRYTDDVAYGRFVLVQAGVLLLIAGHRAWVVDPLTVVAAAKSPAIRREMAGSIRTGLRRFMAGGTLLALMIPLGANLFGLIAEDICLLLALGILAGWAAVERDYLRGVLMIYARPETVLGADVVYVAVLVASVLFAVWLPLLAAAIATLGLMLAAVAGTIPAHRSLAGDPGWQTVDATRFWREMRPLATWATVGAMIYWILGQGYNYILVLKLDTTAVAEVNAIRLLLMPAYLLTIGIKGLLLPMSVRWVQESGFAFLIKRLTQFIAVLAVLDCIYFVLLWVTGDWVIANVLNKQIDNHLFMILMWSLLAVINLVRDIYLTALLVRKRFKQTAKLVAATAAISVVCMWFALDYFGAAGALVGLAAGELFFLAGTGWMIMRELRRQLPGEGQAVLGNG